MRSVGQLIRSTLSRASSVMLGPGRLGAVRMSSYIRRVPVVAALSTRAGRSASGWIWTRGAVTLTARQVVGGHMAVAAVAYRDLHTGAAVRRVSEPSSDVEPKAGVITGENLRTWLARAVEAYSSGNYSEAERHLQAFVRVTIPHFGERHPAVLGALNNLAIVLNAQGRLQEALSVYERVLEGQRAINGDTHPTTLAVLNNLANVKRDLGDVQGACVLLEGALTHLRTALGEEHPTTLTTASTLAGVLPTVGRAQEAQALLERILPHASRAFGADHASVLTMVSHLGNAQYEQGRVAEAAATHRDVYNRRCRTLGDEHPDTLMSGHNLAAMLLLQQLPEGILLLDWVLMARMRVLGERHPDTLMSMVTMARAMQMAGRNAGALKTLEYALRLYREVLGETHPTVAELERRVAELSR